jgi:hypothetical protein
MLFTQISILIGSVAVFADVWYNQSKDHVSFLVSLSSSSFSEYTLWTGVILRSFSQGIWNNPSNKKPAHLSVAGFLL